MKKKLLNTALLAALTWIVPVAAFAIEAPPPPEVPFFGWLAVPIVAVAGQKLLKKKKNKNSDRF